MTHTKTYSIQPYSHLYYAPRPAPDARTTATSNGPARGGEAATALRDIGLDYDIEDSIDSAEHEVSDATRRDLQLLEGGNGRERPTDDELLSDLQSEGNDLRSEAKRLGNRIRRSRDLSENADTRAELLEELEDLYDNARNVVDEGQLEELEEWFAEIEAEFEEAKGEAEDFAERNPMPAKRLVDFLRENGMRQASESEVENLLEDFNLDGEKLNRLTLPLSETNAQNVLGLLRRLDPNVDAAWDSGTTPYSTDNIDRLTEMLGAIFPESRPAVREREVIRLIDQNYDVAWNGDAIKSRITENSWMGWEGSRTTARRVFDSLDQAVKSGSAADATEAAEQLGGWMGAGQENWRKNDWNRTIVSAIWTEAHQNPYLFRRLMHLIPDSIRREMVSVLRSNGGELEEFQPGDVWNSRDTADMIEWTLQAEDGPPPTLGPVDPEESPGASRSPSNGGETTPRNPSS